jgi:hypothetical protein
MDQGNSAPNALVELPGLGLFFLSDEGPYLLEGALENTGTPTQVIFLGREIRETWEERVNAGQLMSAQAVLNHRDRELWVQVPADGDWRPCLGLVYHYERGTWSFRDGYPINAIVETGDHRRLLVFGSWDIGTPFKGLYVISPGFSTLGEGGTPVTARYVSGWHHTVERQDYVYAISHVYGYGDGVLDFAWRADRQLTPSSPGGVQVMDNSEQVNDRPRWDPAQNTWGTDATGKAGAWSDYYLVRVRHDLDAASAFELSLQWSASTRIRLMGYDLAVGSAQRIPPRLQ